MQPFIYVYLETMIYVDPFMYLKEMQDLLRTDLNLLPAEVPSVLVACRTLHNLNLTRHNFSIIPHERFTALQLGHKATFRWENRIFAQISNSVTYSNVNTKYLELYLILNHVYMDGWINI